MLNKKLPKKTKNFQNKTKKFCKNNSYWTISSSSYKIILSVYLCMF